MRCGIEDTVKRILLLALVMAVVLPVVILAASRSPERLARLISADEPTQTSRTTSTTTVDPGASTTTTAPKPSSTTTTTSTTEPSQRHEEPQPSTTTTTTEPNHHQASRLSIACSAGDQGVQVACEWGGVVGSANRLVLTREQPGSPAEAIWSTDDTKATRHVDESAEPGVTYVYRISSYRDGQFLETSNAARVMTGGGPSTTAPQRTTSPQQWYIRMSCRLNDDQSVFCSWAEPPVAVAEWRVVRRHAGDNEIPIPTTQDRRITDPTAEPGMTYTYVLNGYDSQGRSVVLASATVSTGRQAPTTTTTTEVGCCASGTHRR